MTRGTSVAAVGATLCVLAAAAGCSSSSNTEQPPNLGGVAVGVEQVGEPVILQLSGGESVEIQADGAFAFPTALPAGSTYTAALAEAPTSSGGAALCSLLGAQGVVDEAALEAISLRCIPSLSIEGEFTPDGLLISWTEVDASTYNVFAMPEGNSDIDNYSAYPDAEMLPDQPVAVLALDEFALGERDFFVEAEFSDGHRFLSDPLSELNATPIGGLIDEDRSLTADESPYKVYDWIDLAAGVTLHIGPGVLLYGEDEELFVYGVLDVEGTADERVALRDLNVIPGPDLEAEDPFRINIAFAVLSGGSLYPEGNAGVGTLSLTDSIIEDLPYLDIWYPDDDVLIARNVFLRTGGISIGLENGVNALVANNVFIDNRGDPSVDTQYAVETWGTYDSSQVVVRYNSFLSTDRIAVQLPGGSTTAVMDARHNYWGTVDEGEIEDMIYDRDKDSTSAGYIPFRPYLSEPHPDTPETDATP